MKQKRLLLIVNPISGTRDKEKLVPQLEAKLSEKNFEVVVRYTKAKGDAFEFARQALTDGFDVVCACGGDGTVNEIASALCNTDMPLAIIPSGSGNGLARHIGLGIDELAAIDIIDFENVCKCDYGEVNGDKFFCTFGTGFDAAVAKKFNEESTRGKTTYIKDAFLEFAKYRPQEYTVTIDEAYTFEIKAYLIAVCNASQYGNNAFIAPGASITDGVFDVIIIKDAPHLQTLLAGLDMLTGCLPNNKQIDIIRCAKVDITPKDDDSHVHLDGDPYPTAPEYHIRIFPAKLHLFTNPKKKKFTPFITPIDCMVKDLSVNISRLFE